MQKGPRTTTGETIVSVESVGEWERGVVPECCDERGQAGVEEEAGAVWEVASWRVGRSVDVGAVAGREGDDRVETGALLA